MLFWVLQVFDSAIHDSAASFLLPPSSKLVSTGGKDVLPNVNGTQTFDLAIQTRPSERPNTSSM